MKDWKIITDNTALGTFMKADWKAEAGLRKACTIFFLVFVMIGISIEFAVQYYFPAASVGSVTLINCLLVFSYSYLIYRRIKTFSNRIGRDAGTLLKFTPKWADSVYYLGFILTLSALIFAFADSTFSGASGHAVNLAQSAIALSSTISALIIRTAWVYWVCPETGDDQNEVDVLEAEIIRLKSSLLELNSAMSLLSIETHRLHGEIEQATIKGSLSEKEQINQLVFSLQSVEMALRNYTIGGMLARTFKRSSEI